MSSSVSTRGFGAVAVMADPPPRIGATASAWTHDSILRVPRDLHVYRSIDTTCRYLLGRYAEAPPSRRMLRTRLLELLDFEDVVRHLAMGLAMNRQRRLLRRGI